MKVSVLLPTLFPNLAQRAIQSLRETGTPDVELEIVVCSPTRIEGEGVRWVQDADPSGNSAAIRQALAKVRGDYVLSFCDDAVVIPGWLAHVLEWGQQHLDGGKIVGLNHGSIGTCFGRLYANFPVARRGLIGMFEDAYYPFIAHWGDVAFSMAVYEAAAEHGDAGPQVFVTPQQVAAFQGDRMGNPESKHRTSAFREDTQKFLLRFGATVGKGWPINNFRQYNMDLPVAVVGESRTVCEPVRAEFVKKYLNGEMPLGDWLDGGAWLMPTHQKAERCQQTLDAIEAMGTITKGIVWVNGGEQPGYDALRLPAGWAVLRSAQDVPVCEMYRQWPSKFPSLSWYGVIPDDVVPEQAGWDVELIRTAGRAGIASANDGWQAPRRMHGATVYGGDLIRALGWMCIPGIKHNFFDDVWETIGRELGIWHTRMDVMTRHDHPWKNDDASKPTYQRTLQWLEEDRQHYQAWFQNRHATDYGKLRAVNSNIREVKIDIKGKKVAICTPCHNGEVKYQYAQSLAMTCTALAMNGALFDTMFIPGESLIMRARNALVKMFLDRDCDYLMFIDSDMGWDAMSVIRLLSYNKDIVAGVGRRKSDEISWCVNLEGPKMRVDDATGLLAARETGAAFMLIKRAALEKMMAVYGPDHTYTDRASGIKYTALFDTRLQDGYMWSEDYVFCQRARSLGMDVWIDPLIRLDHIGTKVYGGTLSETLLAAAAEAQTQQQQGAAQAAKVA